MEKYMDNDDTLAPRPPSKNADQGKSVSVTDLIKKEGECDNENVARWFNMHGARRIFAVHIRDGQQYGPIQPIHCSPPRGSGPQKARSSTARTVKLVGVIPR